MADNAKPTKAAEAGEREGDIFAVRVRATHEQARELVESGEYDTGDHPRFTQGRNGAGSLDLFVSRAQADAIRERGMTVEVVSNQSSRARARIAELGEGDRYEGGKITPRGLGRKIGGRGEGGGPSTGTERRS
jgi:hypothetical protein